jgi:predicted metal-dependent hydrolase
MFFTQPKILNTIAVDDIIVQVRRSARAKRISLKIKNSKPELVVPGGVSIKLATQFLYQANTIKWLHNHLSNQEKITFAHNSFVKILGQSYQVIHDNSKSRGIELIDQRMMIYGDSQNSQASIKRFLARILKEEISRLVSVKTSELGLKYKNITIKEMSTRLGSCSSAGNLNFALKLIFSEYFILEYVVAHEVCHLKEMNHSKNFWLLVESIYPQYKEAKRYLKNNKMVIL